MDIETLHADIRALTDRSEIADLFGRYLHSLDDREFDEAWAARFFTEDASTATPAGKVQGRNAVLENVRTAMSLFDRTVHVGSDYVIEVDGDRALLRAHQLSTHVLVGGEDVFISAGRADNALVRTADGWRLHRADLHITWTQGTPPVLPPELTGARS
ncbi:nuclear transport factor 2 family protein [Streptomyces sp. 8N706]|uniref:nuclear transport factor 2 family protein n=1 Tax=Streptomyces sp. 8N706 TaxID=3457416 RepID=UPI003FCF8334